MAQVESNMYLQQQAPDIAGGISQGLKMRDLANQNQVHQQQFKDEQSTREAFKNNVDENGQVNRSGVLSDLAKSGLGQRAFEMNRQWTLQDMQQQSAVIDNKIKHLDMTGRVMGPVLEMKDPVQQQKAYEDGINTLHAVGAIDKSKAPNQFDPAIVGGYVKGGMNAKDQLEAEHRGLQLQIEKQKADTEAKKFGHQLDHEQDDAVKDTTQMLISARGDKAYQQAGMDLYSGNKMLNGIKALGGPDKMSAKMAGLSVMEMVKMASGGIPTVEELEKMIPNAPPQQISKLVENYKNEPTSANAGAFIRQLQTYAGALMGDAKDVIRNKHSEVLQSQSSRLTDKNYSRLHQVFVKNMDDPNELLKLAAPAAGGDDKKSAAPDPYTKLGVDPNKLSDKQKSNLQSQALEEIARRKKVAGK